MFPHLEQRLRHDGLALVQLVHPLLGHGWPHLQINVFCSLMILTNYVLYLNILTAIGDVLRPEEGVDVLVDHRTGWSRWTS